MRTRHILLSSLTGVLGACVAGTAAAQVDVEPPMPNVMILLDTSGSMSRKMDGSEVTACSTGDTTLRDVRWFALVDALTGHIDDGDIGCNLIDRSSAAFTSVYGTDVPDLGYYLPFVQVTSSGCGMAPNPSYLSWSSAGATSWTDFPSDAILPLAGGSACTFNQQSDGIIDAYKRTVRFGLMTFDPLVEDDVGIKNKSAPNDADVDVATGKLGTWSYWYESAADNWYANDDGPSPHEGRPPACGLNKPMEVGSRGPAAPPWEGRLMGFGYEKATSEEVSEANSQIEQIILSTRPYGATPLAGMMSDFRDLALAEEHYLPGQSGRPDRPLGSKLDLDTLWQEGDGCRPFHVILISDGEPNLDLRPDCTDNDVSGAPPDPGVCPFDPIVVSSFYNGGIRAGEDGIVNDLYDNNGIIFHVVGIAVGEFQSPAAPGGATEKCTDDEYTYVDGSRCDLAASPAPSPEEKTCCLLNSIQYVGNGNTAANKTASYASNAAGVRGALDDILTKIASGTATRTMTTYSTVGPDFYKGDAALIASDTIVGHEVRAALETTVGDGMWGGQIARSRIVCEDVSGVLTPLYKDPDAAKGDVFETNIAVSIGTSRTFLTAVSDDSATESWRTLRPFLSASDPDDMGVVDATSVFERADNFVTDATVASGMGPLSVSDCTGDFAEPTPSDCAAHLLRWYVGMDSTAAPGYQFKRGNPLGAIYHSQPVIVGPPREFIRDEAYDDFALRFASRPTVLYAASVDGQLHAFKMADNDEAAGDNLDREDVAGAAKGDVEVDRATENNELWSFVPPIVLGRLQSGFNQHSLLLDGGITVANLPATRAPNAANLSAYLTGGQYSTFLVGSSGRASQVPGGGYYYALDVTDPRPDDGTAGIPRLAAPRFLWQLSRTDAGSTIDDPDAMLFGDAVPAAAVTTINYEGTEVAVAILAGGMGAAPAAGTLTTNYSTATVNGYPLHVGGAPVRDAVRNWGAAARPDRSITVVRMDTGEILFRFVGQAIEKTSGPSSTIESTRVRVGNFYSPMSGTPVAYPGLPGQVSTRVFIGDADGILWALDMSDPDPDNPSGGWKLQVAWDAYHATNMSDAAAVAKIGPVETVPIVSVDESSNPIILFATGSQESFYSTTGQNFVVSVRGTPDPDFALGTFNTSYDAIWELDLTAAGFGGVDGQRVTGPLNLFDGNVYFATFEPSGDSCRLGNSRIWALDYDAPGPTSAIDFDGDATIETPQDAFYDQAGTVFGVAIGQLPSCRVGTADTSESDSVFGGYTSFQSAPPGKFQLIIQTGRPAPLLQAGGSINANADRIERLTRELPPIKPRVQIDSWAAIVE